MLEEMSCGQLPSDVCHQMASDMEQMSKRQLEDRASPSPRKAVVGHTAPRERESSLPA